MMRRRLKRSSRKLRQIDRAESVGWALSFGAVPERISRGEHRRYVLSMKLGGLSRDLTLQATRSSGSGIVASIENSRLRRVNIDILTLDDAHSDAKARDRETSKPLVGVAPGPRSPGQQPSLVSPRAVA